jgi:hypothetical protein
MPGRVRLLFFAGLLVVGALGSFALVSYRAPSPVKSVADQVNFESGGPPAPANPQAEGAEHGGHGSMSSHTPPIAVEDIEEEWGMRLSRLTLIAAGGLVDLRYEVTDPQKASKVLDPEQPAYLLDEASGKAVTTAQFPRLGNLRPQSKDLEGGRAYFMEFSNPGGFFESGDRVTLVLGSHRLEHAVVH